LAVWRIEQEAGVGEAHEQVSTVRGFLLAMKDFKVTLPFKSMSVAEEDRSGHWYSA
jgi:hypothetical protein